MNLRPGNAYVLAVGPEGSAASTPTVARYCTSRRPVTAGSMLPPVGFRY